MLDFESVLAFRQNETFEPATHAKCYYCGKPARIGYYADAETGKTICEAAC